jgi:hypothetical protein
MKNLGKPLSREEMKVLTGGAASPEVELCFTCTNGNTYHCQPAECGMVLHNACNLTGCTCVGC